MGLRRGESPVVPVETADVWSRAARFSGMTERKTSIRIIWKIEDVDPDCLVSSFLLVCCVKRQVNPRSENEGYGSEYEMQSWVGIGMQGRLGMACDPNKRIYGNCKAGKNKKKNKKTEWVCLHVSQDLSPSMRFAVMDSLS